MAKNLGREFATMTDEERRRFALEHQQSDDTPKELDLEEPRGDDQEESEPRKEG